jgi:hypothetical protein
MTDERVWLDVPYAEKEEAKALGACWDNGARRWFAVRSSPSELVTRWAAEPDLPTLLPGEDRTFGEGLFVDLVPSSCWFTNVRICVAPRDWERIRRMITSRTDSHCEACGRPADRETGRRMEAHERWSFDDILKVQTLRRLVCLCQDCHQTTHFGLAQIRGMEKVVRAHLAEVTGMIEAQIEAHLSEAKRVWRQRSVSEWTLDLSMLTSAGVRLSAPPDPIERARVGRSVMSPQVFRSRRHSPPRPDRSSGRRQAHPGS